MSDWILVSNAQFSQFISFRVLIELVLVGELITMSLELIIEIIRLKEHAIHLTLFFFIFFIQFIAFYLTHILFLKPKLVEKYFVCSKIWRKLS